jgi:hypothetical protein
VKAEELRHHVRVSSLLHLPVKKRAATFVVEDSERLHLEASRDSSYVLGSQGCVRQDFIFKLALLRPQIGITLGIAVQDFAHSSFLIAHITESKGSLFGTRSAYRVTERSWGAFVGIAQFFLWTPKP